MDKRVVVIGAGASEEIIDDKAFSALSRCRPDRFIRIWGHYSAVVVHELSGDQLFIVRKGDCGQHEMRLVSSENAIQRVARLYPEALLARTVIVCEGASEVGLLRGLDRYRVSKGRASAYANATAFVDAGGRSPEHILERAQIFAQWGYRTKVFLDADVPIPQKAQDAAETDGVKVCTWGDSLALEEALFKWLPDYGVDDLIKLAIKLNSEELVGGALEEVSKKSFDLGCSGLMKPDTHLGENARQIEVSDDQTTPFLFR
jgi:hypothetical protein